MTRIVRSQYMKLQSFLDQYLSELEKDEAKYNLMLGLLAGAQKSGKELLLWPLGNGTACALQLPPHNIVLGELNHEQARALAAQIHPLDFLGVVGSPESCTLVSEALNGYGVSLALDMPQMIYRLAEKPLYPTKIGNGRNARPEDLKLFIQWFRLFCEEALPAETPMLEERMKETFESRPVFFWVVEGEPVSMAARSRETKYGSNISLVYTPKDKRGQGFAGAVTAYACESSFSEGKKHCFLYTDLRNPFSNRAYKKIGFKAWCESSMFKRV